FQRAQEALNYRTDSEDKKLLQDALDARVKTIKAPEVNNTTTPEEPKNPSTESNTSTENTSETPDEIKSLMGVLLSGENINTIPDWDEVLIEIKKLPEFEGLKPET